MLLMSAMQRQYFAAIFIEFMATSNGEQYFLNNFHQQKFAIFQAQVLGIDFFDFLFE